MALFFMEGDSESVITSNKISTSATGKHGMASANDCFKKIVSVLDKKKKKEIYHHTDIRNECTYVGIFIFVFV